MKNSEQDQNPEPGEAERDVQPHAVTTGSAGEETLEVREGDGADAEGFDDEESLSAVENIPAGKCSACGVPAGNTTLSIHDGLRKRGKPICHPFRSRMYRTPRMQGKKVSSRRTLPGKSGLPSEESRLPLLSCWLFIL